MIKSISKILISVFLIVSAISFSKLPGTNSFFNDTVSVSENSFSAGYWIPKLKMSVDPVSNDGLGEWYKTKPCVTLETSITDSENTKIFYRLNSDKNYSEYNGICIEIPDGIWNFDAYAIFNSNSEWKSNEISETFKVDTTLPIVNINDPDNNDTVSGQVEIKGTVTDLNLDSYKLEIEDSNGNNIFTQTTASNSFTNKMIYSWNTIGLTSGMYKIILSGKDLAGNKNSDTVQVKVDNEVKFGNVVINEVMWMGSEGKPNDQWIELKNVSNKDIHLKDWYLTYKKEDTGNENKLIEITDNRVIKKGEYLLITHYKKSNSAIDENPDFDGMENFDYGKFQIKLYTNKDKKTLIDVSGNGTESPKEGKLDEDNRIYHSMERNNTPGDGTKYSNWHTCEDLASSEYWKEDRIELGTPGNENLSENDPSEKKSEDEDKKNADSLKPENDKKENEEVEEPKIENNIEPIKTVTEEKPVIENPSQPLIENQKKEPPAEKPKTEEKKEVILPEEENKKVEEEKEDKEKKKEEEDDIKKEKEDPDEKEAESPDDPKKETE